MVRIYDLLNLKCLTFFDFGNNYILKVAWSPSRSSVFACVLSNGDTHIFDLSITYKYPIETLKIN